MCQRELFVVVVLGLIWSGAAAVANEPLPPGAFRPPPGPPDPSEVNDSAPPRAQPGPAAPEAAASEPVKIVIRYEQDRKVGRLVIPKRFLGAAAVQPLGAQPPVPGAQPANESASSLPVIQSIAAGIALSLACVAVFLAVRRGGKRRIAIAVVAVVLLASLGVWAMTASANIGRPLLEPASPPIQFLETVDPEVVIEVVETGDEVKLTLPAVKLKDAAVEGPPGGKP